MSLKELEKVSVEINGVRLKLGYDIFKKEPAYYGYAFVTYFDDKLIRQKGTIPFSNPLTLSLYQSRTVSDLILTYRGKRMRLLFDIDWESYAAFDSLPFQSGTFHLTSKRTDTRCDGSGPCLVSSKNWDGSTQGWVRHLIWNDLWVTGTKTEPNRCDASTVAINNQTDWASAWNLYRLQKAQFTVQGAVQNLPVPAVDFTTEIVLVTYMRNRPDRPTRDSFVVGGDGDLKFQPPQQIKPWFGNFCSMVMAVFYRSGVESINGKPLPPPRQY